MAETPDRITPNLYVTQSRLFKMNSGIFLSNNRACLVDPGMYPDELDAIAAFLEEQGATVEVIILTHSHWDHILGPERFPNVRTVAYASFPEVVQAEGDEALSVINNWISKNNLERSQPFALPIPSETFSGETSIQVGELTLKLRFAPGHAADQIMILEESSCTLWAADMLSDFETPIVGHSVAAYRQTLDAISPLRIQALVPGHGTPTVDPLEIRDRLEEDIAYLKALHTRVEKAVKEGKSLAEARALCEDIEYRNPTENKISHDFSVQRAYAELGGSGAAG